MPKDLSPEEVVDYWFAPGMEARWFKKDDGFDEELRQRFEPAHELAAAGELDGWKSTPAGCVALCILLDQVPRNLYRGQARAFATDAAARAVSNHALDAGFDRDLSQPERCFLYMPFEHSEDLADQERCVELMAALDDFPDWRKYAVAHRDIVARFGRFPHRNAALDRESTPEEAAFLTQPGSSF